METDLKKLFTTAQNFGLLREKLGEYNRLPSEIEVREFLVFFDNVYTAWKANNPLIDLHSIEEKAKARRVFVKKLGIRS